MWDMNDITCVRHVRGYVCYIEFDDGSSGEIDLAAYLNKGPIFAALADIDVFKQVRIEGGTLSWPNGDDRDARAQRVGWAPPTTAQRDPLPCKSSRARYNPSMPTSLLSTYAAQHNESVRTEDFAPLAALFAPDAELHFVGLPMGPFLGRPAILQAFTTHPPDDELILSNIEHTPTGERANYAWKAAPTLIAGTIDLTPGPTNRIHLLRVSVRPQARPVHLPRSCG